MCAHSKIITISYTIPLDMFYIRLNLNDVVSAVLKGDIFYFMLGTLKPIWMHVCLVFFLLKIVFRHELAFLAVLTDIFLKFF